MPMPEQVLDGAEIKWIPCPGCAGEIGVPPHWLAHTVACPKCGAIISISEIERVLWRPPKPKRDPPWPSSTRTAESASVSAAPAPHPSATSLEVQRHVIGARAEGWCTAIVAVCCLILIGMTIWLLAIAPESAQVSRSATALNPKHSACPESPNTPAEMLKPTTSAFGIEATGNKFVYVFDGSASMVIGEGNSWGIAKAELLKSLARLSADDRFQIIFNNDRPSTMNVGNQVDGMLVANQQNKSLAEQYVRGVVADGGTRHADAIKAALSLKPDVIFFLTDCEFPAIPAEELARLQRLNGDRTVIHAIELGIGAKGRADNFLTDLARQNGGEYAYVDFSRPGVPNPVAAAP